MILVMSMLYFVFAVEMKQNIRMCFVYVVSATQALLKLNKTCGNNNNYR